MPIQRKVAWVDQGACVACGCCGKVCPKKAISVPHGIYAVVNQTLCVGCGKCSQECPASVIFMRVKDKECSAAGKL